MSIIEVTTAVVQNGFTFSVAVIPFSFYFWAMSVTLTIHFFML